MQEELTSRDTIQYDALVSWKEHEYQGTVILPTGMGKSRIAVVAAGSQIKDKKISSCLVVTPTIPLLIQWKKEFEVWGYATDNIDFMCIKSAHKLTKQYDLLIIDEIHTALSPKYRSIFFNINYSQLMGLTATKPHNEEYLKLLNIVCPIIYQKRIEDALNIDAIADYHVYNLEVPLNRSENGKYRLFDTNLRKAQLEIGMAKRSFPNLIDISIFDIAKEYATKKIVTQHEKHLVKYARQFWSAMTLRKWICYEAESKISPIIKILQKFPERKWIIFNKSIKYADKIHKALLQQDIKSKVYHSQLKTIEREDILNKFGENEFRILIAVDALNAGLNVPDTDSAICVAGVSTELTNTQQLGRLSRKSYKDKVSLFINLYAKGTVEETWVKNKTEKLKNITWLTSIDKINHASISEKISGVVGKRTTRRL